MIRRLLMSAGVFAALAFMPARSWAIAYVPASHTAIASSTTAGNNKAHALAAATAAGNDVLAFLQWKTVSSRAVAALQAASCTNSSTVAAYSGSTNYTTGQCATDASILWVALQNGSAHTPAFGSAYWAAAGSFLVPYAQQKYGASFAAMVAVCRKCAAINTVMVTFGGGTNTYTLEIEEYSGVAALGKTRFNTGSSANPSLSIATVDANNWIAVSMASLSNAGLMTCGSGCVGSLRDATRNGTNSSYNGGAACDATSAAPGTATCTLTMTSGTWATAGIELRTVAPSNTHVWPDCPAGEPCIVYHRDPPAIPQSSVGYGPNFYFSFQPSFAGNEVVLRITYPNTCGGSACSITSIAVSDLAGNTITTDKDGGALNWSTCATAAGASYTTVFKCAANVKAGMAAYHITLSAAIGAFDVMHVGEDEISDAAGTDGSSSATAVAAGVMQPGAIATNFDGDLILVQGMDSTGNPPGPNGSQISGMVQPDYSAASPCALLTDSSYENIAVEACYQPAHASVNPALYVNAMEVNKQDSWQLAAVAIRKSPGAGTRPSAGHAWVVRDHIQWCTSTAANPSLCWVHFPTQGNALVADSTHYQSLIDLRTLKDNYGASFTSNTVTDTSGDPQQYATCFGATGQNPDRVLTYNPVTASSVILSVRDIAGAKVSGGAAGCIGARDNHKTGSQGASANANVVTSAFTTPWSFVPALNGSAYSAVIVTIGFGTGPPSLPCVSGGVTPPTCTGDMVNFTTWDSIFADNNIDASHYTTGDMYGYYYTNSTAGMSFDMKTNNASEMPAGGSGVNGAAIEILGEPAAPSGNTRKRVRVLQ